MKRSRPAAMVSRLRAARPSSVWCIVGTAVNQLGRAASNSRKKRKPLKPAVQTTEPPEARGGEHGRDQPVDVEQRHDVEAGILRPERQRAADVIGRGGDVDVSQRHDLGPRRGAGGVQDERQILRRRHAGGGRRARERRLRHQREQAGHGGIGHQLDHRQAARGGDRAGRAWHPLLDHQRARAEVGEVEVELVLAIGRVERGRWWRRRRGRRRALAISGPFGATIASRSPRPMPRPLRSATVRAASARSAAWPSRRRSSGPPVGGAPIAGASSAPAASRPGTVSAG